MGLLRQKVGGTATSGLIEKKSEEGTKPTRYYSKKQENAIAEAVGGSRTLNSGATMFAKGDITTDDWLLEAKTKTTHADSISIKKSWLEKNQQEALFMGKKYSALVFSFGPDEPNHYVIDEYLFQDLIEYLKNKEEES